MATNPNIAFSNNNPSYLFTDYPDQKNCMVEALPYIKSYQQIPF